ncbi:MAG: YggU family protein [Gammaproteobacteria bacterium]|nr:YggU family protein [Gammaproteobacteria bacterium]
MNAPELRWYHWDGADLILAVHLQPRARQDEIVGAHGDRLKIRITAPPVDGKANAHLIRFLATICGVPISAVELLAGTSGRDKRLRIRAPRTLPPPLPSRPVP